MKSATKSHRRFALKSGAVWLACALVFALCGQLTRPAHAQLISNGGFEAGLTGWTKTDQLGSDGTFFLQSGTASPLNGIPVPAPPQGTNAAMTDAGAGGSHVLFQDFVVGSTPSVSANLDFSLYINNGAPDFFTPTVPSLDFSTPALNQQARVDILLAGTDPFSLAAGDVLMNVFQTHPGDPLVSGYSAHTTDIASVLNAHLGQTLRLRFAETDNVGIFLLGVDAVSLAPVPVPEPTSILPLGTALIALLYARRRLRRA